MKNFLRSSTGAALLVPAAAACAILFPCAEVYLRNRAYFSLSLRAAAGFGATAFLVCFLAGAAVLLVLRRTRFFSAAAALFLGSCVSFLFQYLFWSGFFPEAPRDIVFAPYMLFLAAIHLILLLVPPATAVFFRRTVIRNASGIAAVIILTQLVSVACACFDSRTRNYDFTEHTLSEAKKFEFGRKENVIVLVVDAMGERLCKEVMAQYPEVRDLFRDFVCFDRMTSPIPRTMYAVPAILTGIAYPHVNGVADDNGHAGYLQRACRSENSLFQSLRKRGFRVEGYPFLLQTISYSPDVIDNSVPVSGQVEKHSAMEILDTAVSRQIPFFIKPFLEEYYYVATDRFTTPRDPETAASGNEPFDVAFFRGLDRTFRVGERDKVFKYLHISGAHDPLETDERLAVSPETNRVRQLRGALRIVELLLAKLKNAKLYDDAVIVVIGDHTEFYAPENLAFIKRRGERHGKLVFNALPCTTADVAGTVLKEVDPSFSGKSLFDKPLLAGDGSCRRSLRLENERLSPWEKAGPIPTGRFTLYSKAFGITGNRLFIKPDFDVFPPAAEATLFVRDTATGACRTCRGTVPKDDRFLMESPELALPDGVYQLFLRTRTPGERSAAVLQSLPQFLTVSGGTYRWENLYPVRPRAMRLGEEIRFRAMRPYPQVEFPDGTAPRVDGFILEEGQSLGIRLPALAAPARLTVRADRPVFPPGVMTLYKDGVAAARLAAGDRERCVLTIPLPPGEARTMKLHIGFTAKRQGRDKPQVRARLLIAGFALRTDLPGAPAR